ncbi:TIGR03915 family putative DNA repair protein [Maribellus sp. CM-23]|uniref:TIGR03915 family putative DNA repair protein n=1 Tax=Maribellus sp. CM-23 TaxID=2781026 RepID=UPI001F40E895|nr:TIGR03915 family putative DNA repair protein [Maribellus sp. CM-23]MCE4563414.1 TIGR03915 family putative DNA repair protein [Maribellus sp. CM-23]
MKIYTYDNSFEGLLTAVFECYSRKDFPVDICARNTQSRYLFLENVDIHTDPQKAERVWKGVQAKMSGANKQLLFYAFLSEEQGIEMKIYRFLRRLFSGYMNLETDYGDSDVMSLTQSSQKVKKEAMRIMQFVRFQRTKDGMFFCGIEPKFDVLPLVVTHYQKRFADQRWLIYDLQRNYGVYYDKNEVKEVEISKKQFNAFNGQVKQALLDEGEDFYQKLWRSYFKHINIEERKNLRLQLQHMPRRFWKYLPEKQAGA